jgi:hypothetical protein
MGGQGCAARRFFFLGLESSLAAAALLLTSSFFLSAQTQDFWNEKPVEEWSPEEALALLTNSLWAQEVRVQHFTGRFLEGKIQKERRYVSAHGRPKISVTVEQAYREPELAAATYRVSWGSAEIVQRGRARLAQVAPQAVAELHPAPPEALPHDDVVTVQVVRPPPQPHAHLFQGVSERELLAGAELRLGQDLSVKPARVLSYGMGAGAGLAFFFPRQQGTESLLPPGTEWAEFVFVGERGNTLKVKFALKEMGRAGPPES